MATDDPPKKARSDRKTLSYEQEVQLEALAAYLTLQQIADHFGMARSTFCKLMEDDPDLRARYDMGRAKVIAEVGEKLLEKIRKGDTASIFFFLKTQAGWRETNKLEVSGPEGGPVQTLDLSKLSDAALKEMLAVADAQKEEPAGG